MRKARLLLADDHAIILDGLTRLLEPEFEVVGKAEDGRAMLEMSARLKPDVIIADISMPLLSGIEAVRQLRGEAHPKVQVKNCDIALAQGTGGMLGSRHGAATLIMKRE